MQLIPALLPSAGEGRAFWPSLFISAAALLALAASLLSGEAYRWLAIALLLFACAPWRLPPANAISALIAAFCGWQVLDAVFVSPAYQAEGINRPFIFFCAFAAFAALRPELRERAFRAGAILLAALVGLGLLQHLLGMFRLSINPQRASATFITPNTFATAIDLFLLPLMALILAGHSSRRVYSLALWLFAGLVATQSRGGMLALFAGLAFVLACLGREGLRAAAWPALRLLGGGAAVWLLVVGLGSLLTPVVFGPGGEAPSADAWLGRATWDRELLYSATLKLIQEHPLAGAGAGMFVPLFEPQKPPAFGEHAFLFAHSDYLQFWLELGLPGIVLFMALGAAALWAARRAYRSAPADPQALACGAALAACFAHAAVDFPFYVPFLLFVSGAYLGTLAAMAGDRWHAEAWRRFAGAAGRAMTPALRGIVVLCTLAWLSQPMAAQLAGSRALAVMGRGDVTAGIYWQSVARRLEPRNQMHYWAEAVIWRELAIDSANRDYGDKADALLIEGMRANPPFDFALLLERARLHRRHPGLLGHPAAPAEILAWTEQAVARAPESFDARLERALALSHAGRTVEARAAAGDLLRRRPDSRAAQKLAEDLR